MTTPLWYQNRLRENTVYILPPNYDQMFPQQVTIHTWIGALPTFCSAFTWFLSSGLFLISVIHVSHNTSIIVVKHFYNFCIINQPIFRKNCLAQITYMPLKININIIIQWIEPWGILTIATNLHWNIIQWRR